MLKYSFHNSKLNGLAHSLGLVHREVVSFDLPAGWTCAKSGICKTLAARDTGKITRHGRVMCYAAKAEAYSPATRRMRWHNFDLLSSCKNDILKMFALLTDSLPRDIKIVRIHSSGDFFSRQYFQAWVMLATYNPDIIFFGYTKHLDYATAMLPENMFLEYSYGSRDDSKMRSLKFHVPTCFIGEHKGMYTGYKIVCKGENSASEDYHAILAHKSFVIMMH